MQKAVDRGIKRRQHKVIENLCVDETSFRKGHDYVTIVSSQEGYVEGVYEGKSKNSLNLYYATLTPEDKRQIKSISMDMSPAYRAATKASIPQANRVMCFDRYHVAAYINDAVDSIRKEERLTLKTELSGSRYVWLKSPKKLSDESVEWIKAMSAIAKNTGAAWVFKESAREFWNYGCKTVVTHAWLMWCKRVHESGLKPLIRVARIIQNNLRGIVNAIIKNVTNATAESINSKIKVIKHRCRGFRNRERFKRAILFYCGGLELYPDLPTH
jgi:transposase